MPHRPLVQDSIALGKEQMVPQEPQLLVLVSEVSQPFPSAPSQFPQPAEQELTWQVPVAQVPTARLGAQRIPQPPQSVLVRVDVSQPVEESPSQSA